MTRRKPSGWHYSGVVQGRKAGGRRRRPAALMPKSWTGTSHERRSGAIGFGVTHLSGLANWAIYQVANKKWRPLAFSEAVVWLAASAVCIAFLVLMAKGSFLLAASIFIVMIVYAWRELGEN